MYVGVLAQPNANHLVGAHVVPLVEGKRRELDRREVCPGGPTGRSPARGRSSTRAGRGGPLTGGDNCGQPGGNRAGCPHLV